MSESTLKERLGKLECQFTWNLQRKDKLNINDILQTLEIKLQHGSYPHLSTLYNIKAFLLHLQQRSNEAIQSLRQAEEHVTTTHKSVADQRIVITYGNYAWIYYHLNNFYEVEAYLQKIQDIYSTFSNSILYSSEVYAEQAWCFLEVGINNGCQSKMYFKKALNISPNDNYLLTGLAYSTFAHASYAQDPEVREESITLLDELLLKEPGNWEARVYLAKMLQDTGLKKNLNRSRRLVANGFQECSNPEVLRILAGLFRVLPFNKCIDILHRAKCIAPNYHKLTHEMGHIYRHQAYHLRDAEWSTAIAEASKFYRIAIQLMPWNMYARLDLANMHRLKYQTEFEGIIYSMINNETETMSKACKQRFFLQYGIYFLYSIHCVTSGIEMLKRGFEINPNSKFGVKCKKNLTFYILLDSSKEEEIDGFINEIEDAQRSKLLK